MNIHSIKTSTYNYEVTLKRMEIYSSRSKIVKIKNRGKSFLVPSISPGGYAIGPHASDKLSYALVQ